MRIKHPQWLRVYIFIFIVACVTLLVVLSLFQALWVVGGSGTTIMYQAGLQRGRVERIAKDVLVLAYRPTGEHAQAVNELQNILPVFEHAQQALQSGDRVLGLPLHPPDGVLSLMTQSQPDYMAIDTATKQIIVQPDKPIDSVEIDIITAHERAYFLTLSQVNTTWMQYIDAAFWQIFLIEEGITLVVIGMLVVNYVFVSRKVYNSLAVEEKKEQTT